jgi:transcriptional regulator with XRE-family HTH domain
MPVPMLAKLGIMARERRGAKGVREAAAEIGISPATLSRIEAGKLPDIATFRKLCIWLAIDASDILQLPPTPASQVPPAERPMIATFHARAPAELSPQAAADMAALIIAAQKELARRVKEGRLDVPTWL